MRNVRGKPNRCPDKNVLPWVRYNDDMCQMGMYARGWIGEGHVADLEGSYNAPFYTADHARAEKAG